MVSNNVGYVCAALVGLAGCAVTFPDPGPSGGGGNGTGSTAAPSSASSASSGGPGSSCDGTANCSGCVNCADNNFCTQLDAMCAADTGCNQLSACVGACPVPTTNACASPCLTGVSSASQMLFAGVYDCLFCKSCREDCGPTTEICP